MSARGDSQVFGFVVIREEFPDISGLTMIFVSETWSSSRQLGPDFAKVMSVMSTSSPSLQLP